MEEKRIFFKMLLYGKKIRQQQNKYLKKKRLKAAGRRFFFCDFFFSLFFFAFFFLFSFRLALFFCYSSCFLRSLSPPSSPTPSLFFAIRWQKCATTKRRWAKRRTLRNLFFSFFFLSFFPRVGVFCFPRFVFFC